MRSKALPPARAQGHIVPFLEAAALFAALCIFARTAALMLAAAITAPLPIAETLFWLGRQSAQEQPASSVQVEAAPDSTPAAAASSLPQAVQALTGNIEDYLVPLLGEEARPADAGTVIEKNYPQGSGEKYIPCGAGSIKNNTRQTAADIAAEVAQPLPFAIEKDSAAPQVLIMHTHGSEAYTMPAGQEYTPTGSFRTDNDACNVVRVGDEIAAALSERGISVLHDRTLHDVPDYNDAYPHSLASVEDYMEKYPSLVFVLDVHRDAVSDADGNQYKLVSAEEPHAAQMSFIMGNAYDGWQENLKLAIAIQQNLSADYPTLMRPITMLNYRYNQFVSPGAMLLEVGAAGNSLDEALYAARLFAQGFADTLQS